MDDRDALVLEPRPVLRSLVHCQQALVWDRHVPHRGSQNGRAEGPGGASTVGVGARRCYGMCRGAALVTGLASHRGRGAADNYLIDLPKIAALCIQPYHNFD